MMELKKILQQNKGCKIALYGLGTETARFLSEWGSTISIIGLLDGFRKEGELYGYPILPYRSAVEEGVTLIIVVARPGSCKAIAKKIGGTCREHGIALFDVRGIDLLEPNAVAYGFSHAQGKSKATLLEKINQAEIISFDLFDTLVMRQVYSYTDIFELVDWEMKSRGIYIPNFAKLRLSAEKELSMAGAPTLEAIYEELLKRAGGSFLSAAQLAELEWTIDLSTMIARDEVCDIFHQAIASGKRSVITTDSYYNQNRIKQILDRFGISGYEKLIVSCEYGTSKTQDLFDVVCSLTGANILHIGDDPIADVESAERRGMNPYRLLSGSELLDALGGMGLEDSVSSLSDRVKIGLFISKLFNHPFWFESAYNRVSVSEAEAIGYLFCSPMITDFILWMRKKMSEQDFRQVLFCARDGYLVGRLYRKLDTDTKSMYFLTSRAAAIRAGIETEEDIAYVDSMKFFGTEEQALKMRFGIGGEAVEGQTRKKLILSKAEKHKENYWKYIEKLGVLDAKIAVFDFVAKGTTQLYLGKLFRQHMKGFYFLQLEPEFMADKGLDVEPFYSDEEKNGSAIFENYYILETMLTSPYSQMEEFDADGNPWFAEETRSEEDIRCFERIQAGIEKYFDDYIRLLPEHARTENKRLDEVLLSLVNRIQILDEEFMDLKVEDPFFGRMTDIKDVIG